MHSVYCIVPNAQAYENRGRAHSQKGDKALALADYRNAARGFAPEKDNKNFNLVIERLGGLQAEMTGVSLCSPILAVSDGDRSGPHYFASQSRGSHF